MYVEETHLILITFEAYADMRDASENKQKYCVHCVVLFMELTVFSSWRQLDSKQKSVFVQHVFVCA